ncbi:MAG: dockerin type I domain-containing protein [Acidobacteriota bacterium]|nr:dockerin type I domain-containing protein [Acidobacteriota bacterium]
MKNAIKLQSKIYFLGLIQLILTLNLLASAANAATYAVTNANSTGAGTLRQAILNANANPGADFITFNIPGSGVHTIDIGIAYLPPITDSVTIDGTTQSGYTTHPLIALTTSGAGIGLEIQRGVATIKALNIYNFHYGITVDYEFDSATCDSNRPGLILKGSRIGTNNTGSTFSFATHNAVGVLVNGANAGSTQIGGTGPNDGNVISNSSWEGIRFAHHVYNNCSPNNDPGRTHLVIGNKIGTNYAGTAAIPNKWSGISVKTKKVKIGGDTPAERNIISGNNEHGIIVYGDNTVIEGNYIGTNAAGNAALPNLLSGVSVSGGDNVRIGGTAAGTGNVISGNTENGVEIIPDVPECSNCYDFFELAKNNLVYGNRIGTNPAGTAAIPNGKNGVSINAEGTIVGESEMGGATNTISGNSLNGVFVFSSEHHQNFNDPNYALFISSKDSRIQRNYIGTNSSGASLGNGKNGVLIDGDVSNTFIGGNDANQKNLISFNGENGVSLINSFNSGTNAPPVNNQITLNEISSNGLKGISYYTSDAQGSDPKDADAGINNLQNFPVLSAAFPSSITGTYNSVPNKNFVVDFYTSPTCDASGRGEGKSHLGSVTLTTDANGNAGFTTNFGAPAGGVVTATATESLRAGSEDLGNTSEFSNCLTPQTSDPGGFSLDSATYTVNENGSSVTVTVTRTGGTLGGVTVDYSITNGTAKAGQDFVAHSSTLTFAAGQMTKIFAVPILEDNLDEAAETVNIALSNPSVGAKLLSPSAATLTINDNDAPPTLSIADVSLAEGNENKTDFNFVVTKTGPTEQTVTVNYQTVSISATSGVDFTNTTGTLTIAPNETSKAITVPVFGEFTVEVDETFKVILSAPVNATLNKTEALGTILDDDNSGKLGFSQASYNVNENDGTATVTVSRTGGKVGTVTVDYATTNNGTATVGNDFAAASGTLVFLDGETTKTFQIVINDDQTTEQTETVNLMLSSPTGGATISLGTANISIADNDVPATASINGTVFYAITPLNQPQKTVSGVIISASGDSSASDTTDSAGNYSVENLTVGGEYMVSAAKTGDLNGITAFDATMILRHVAAGGQGNNALSVNQQKAADTDADNSVTAFDATQILRFVAANGPNANTGQTGNWKFLPATRNYQSLGNSLTGEHYEALLIGEVDGDWMAPASAADLDNENLVEVANDSKTLKNDGSGTDAEISFSTAFLVEESENTIVIPVMLTNYAGRMVSSYSFGVRFDPMGLQFDAVMPFDKSETLSQEMMVVHSISKSGLIRFAAAKGSNANGNLPLSGILLKLRFKVIGDSFENNGKAGALTFQQNSIFQDNEGVLLNVKRNNGSTWAIARGFDKTAAK